MATTMGINATSNSDCTTRLWLPFPDADKGQRGKVPPIDPFSGENPEVTIEEWLSSLQRAADWNEWSEPEILIQLAGHLCGRALQKWNLLDDIDKENWQCSSKVLQIDLNMATQLLLHKSFDTYTKIRRKQ